MGVWKNVVHCDAFCFSKHVDVSICLMKLSFVTYIGIVVPVVSDNYIATLCLEEVRLHVFLRRLPFEAWLCIENLAEFFVLKRSYYPRSTKLIVVPFSVIGGMHHQNVWYIFGYFLRTIFNIFHISSQNLSNDIVLLFA